MTKAETGRWGEDTACAFLEEKGFRIIGRNHHERCGEIDIIAADEKFICFVEVRTRAEDAMVSGLESIDLRKMQKVFRTACLWLTKNPADLQPRFDIIEITTARGAQLRAVNINHITNAFGAEVCNEIF